MSSQNKALAPQPVHCRGVGFLGLLTLIFITLKLTGHIAWSWWLVLLPLLPAFTLIAGLLLLVVIAATIGLAAKCFEANARRRNNIALKRSIKETRDAEAQRQQELRDFDWSTQP